MSSILNVPLAIVVDKRDAEKVKNELLEMGLLDDSRKIKRYGDKVEIPVFAVPNIKVNFEIVEQEEYLERKVFLPLEEIKEMLKDKISGEDFEKLPRKWEKFGDVLVIKLHGIKEKRKVAEAYAKVLKCKAVLEDIGGIKGIERKPCFKLIYGNDTETIHVENGIKYKFDVSKIMFSSGNIDERIRMAGVANKNEVVVDMFAGIGYFTLPVAVYGKAKVYACEINPVAYQYLKENILLNDVCHLVKPLLGDCREVAPRNIANRVIMGYLDSIKFLPYAIEVLKKEGIIHLHQKCKEEEFPHHLFNEVKKIVKEHDKEAEMIFHKKIKSYAPRIIHGVIDIKIS